MTSVRSYDVNRVNPEACHSGWITEASVYDDRGIPNIYRGKVLSFENGRLSNWDGKVTFEYDAFGRRIKKNDVTFEYIDDKLYSCDVGYFMYDSDGIVGFYNSDNYYYQKNALGDVIGIVNSAGTLVAAYIYDAYGNHKVYEPSISYAQNYYDDDIVIYVENTDPDFIGNRNPIRYRSYYYDTETGLYYIGGRYYDPELCRFIEPADVSSLNPSSINGLNLYSYANNNPIGIVYSSSTVGGTVSGGMVNSIASSVGGFNSGYHGTISNSTQWQFDPNFLTDMFGHIENGFSIIEGAIAGYRNLKHLPKLENLIKVSRRLKIVGIGLGLAVDVHNNFSNKDLTFREQSIGFVVDSLYTVASAALSYVFSAGTEWLIIAFIPGIGPFAMLGGALVSIGVSIFIDWTVEEYGWLDSIKDWVESW